jgi:uncharacterized damage-inducible protein DinB
MTLLQHLRTLARASRLANHRLHAACLQLSQAEFKAARTSFFPSLWETLNHILIVDWYYIAALHREADMTKAWASETPFDTMPALAEAQVASDARLISWCDAADEAAPEPRATRARTARADASAHPPDPSPWAGARHARGHRRAAAAT